MSSRAGLLVLSVILVGCGARTFLDDGVDDDEPVRVDAGPGFDAGRMDAGFDAGAPQTPCTSDAQCAGIGVCRAPSTFTAADLAPHPLVCGTPDRAPGPGAACADSSDCSRGLCSLPGVCMQPCASNADCADDERCREVWVRTGDASMQPLMACAAFFVAAPDATLEGPAPSVMVNEFDTTPETITAVGPESLLIWLADPDGAIPFVDSVRTNATPSVTVFGDPPGPSGPDWGVGGVTAGRDALAILFPNGVNTPASPMGFVFELAAAEPATLERMTVRRTGVGSVFDVDVYLVGGMDLQSPDGRVPQPIARGVDEARFILRTIGVDIGEVRVHEVVGQLRARLGVLERSGGGVLPFPEELPELYRLSAGANRPAVHVFYVRSIDGALGIASGIPGAQVLPGTGTSGVALAGDTIMVGMLGEVMAHEIGHYMGLFHTSELDGDVNDPHPDTGACPASRDANGDGFLAPSECRGFGADNLMFWSGDGVAISPQQAEIFRRAYFVR